MARPINSPAARHRAVHAQAPAAEPAIAPVAEDLERLNCLLLSAGGFGTEVAEETCPALAERRLWPAVRGSFDLDHLPRPERRLPSGQVYSFSQAERCLYGQEDPRTKALATTAGRAYWEPRLRGRDLHLTWRGAGAGGDEIHAALQLYLEERRISAWLRTRLAGFLLPERAEADPFGDLYDAPAAEAGPAPERLITILFSIGGSVGRSLGPHLPYLVREQAAAVLRELPADRRPRLRIIGFGFGPNAFRGLHADALWNGLSYLDDFRHLMQHGYEGVFAGREQLLRSQTPGYDELYFLDAPAPRDGAIRLSDRQLRAFAVEAGRTIALRLTPAVDAKLRQVLENPPGEGEGQGTGFIGTLRTRGLASPDEIVRSLVSTAQADRLLDELARRAAPA